MPDELPDITRIGQAALGLPQAIASTEVAHLTEKMSTFSAEMEKLGTMVPTALPPLPTGTEQLGLPALPGITPAAGEVPKAAPEAPVGGRKVRSYMEV